MSGESAASKQPAKSTRLSVNINQEAAEALRRTAAKRDLSITETVRRAISMYDFVETKLELGSSVQIVTRDGRIRDLRLL